VTTPLTLRLPTVDGDLNDWSPAPAPPPLPTPSNDQPLARVAFAAAHVVMDPLADSGPTAPAAIDWDATLAFRHHLWSHGLGVADAMDTAQRGMGLDWSTTCELISRTGAEATTTGNLLACGAGTDQLGPGPHALSQIVAAYEEQCEIVEDAGARVILMASRALAGAAASSDDYLEVYGKVIGQVREPVILHWLGPMFDPQLERYWGSDDLDQAAASCLKLIHEHPGQIDGIKVSLLDAEREIYIRSQLPDGVRLYTGDDFNYPDLILGDDALHSDALLGIFDPIAPIAGEALRALARSDSDAYTNLIEPTVPLARALFEPPTRFYKTGVVFLAWLSGHQSHFRLVAGLESSRPIAHLAKVFVLAQRAGLFPDLDLAVQRMRALLLVNGVDA
jgi:hypothetical protein